MHRRYDSRTKSKKLKIEKGNREESAKKGEIGKGNREEKREGKKGVMGRGTEK